MITYMASTSMMSLVDLEFTSNPYKYTLGGWPVIVSPWMTPNTIIMVDDKVLMGGSWPGAVLPINQYSDDPNGK